MAFTEMGDLRLEIYQLIGKLFMYLEAADRQLMNQFNLSVTQYWALVYLEDPEELPLSELAFFLIRNKSSMTGLVDKLQNAGLAIPRPAKHPHHPHTPLRLTK